MWDPVFRFDDRLLEIGLIQSGTLLRSACDTCGQPLRPGITPYLFIGDRFLKLAAKRVERYREKSAFVVRNFPCSVEQNYPILRLIIQPGDAKNERQSNALTPRNTSRWSTHDY
jgi:hypothetical protein